MLGMLILGSAGGHKHHWSPMQKERFLKAQIYQMVVSLGLFANGATSLNYSNAIVFSLLSGLGLFVLPLYALAWGKENFPKVVMPIGGISMMVAYGLMLF